MGPAPPELAPPDEALSSRRDVSRVCGRPVSVVCERQTQMARPEKVAVVEEIRTKLAEADATVLTEYRGLTVHELADAAGVAARDGHRVQGVQEHAGPPGGRGRRARERRVDVRGSGRASRSCAATPPPRPRRCATSAATTRRWSLKGGLLGERVITPVEIEALADLPSREVHARAGRGRVPGAADQGGRPVPGVHPQLRLRRARR